MDIISSGIVTVSPGVSSAGLFFIQEGILEIRNDGMVQEIALADGGKAIVSSGGILYLCTVSSGGTATVLDRGFAQDITVDGGLYLVSSGGTAQKSLLQSGGTQIVYLDAMAADVAVLNSGELHVSNGAYALKPVVSTGGALYAWNGALIDQGQIAGNAVVNATAAINSASVVDGGRLSVLANGYAFEAKVSSGGTLDVSSDGIINSAHVYSGGKATLSGGASSYNAEIEFGGTLIVSSGATATGLRENGGYVEVADGANVIFIPNIINDLLLENAFATIHSGTTATNTIVNSGGWLYISAGGIANVTVANSSGGFIVSSGGTADVVTVNYGGGLAVSSGGTALQIKENGGLVYVFDDGTATFVSNSFSGVVLDADNWATVHSGTTATDTAVNSGGYLHVSSGGTADVVSVNYGGGLLVSSGGTADVVTVDYGGGLIVYNGGTALRIKENGGMVFDDDAGTVSFVPNTFSGALLNAENWGTVHSGTTATDTTVGSGGRLDVFSSGRLTGKQTFEAGAVVSAYEGAILDFDLTQMEAGATALINDLSIIQGTPLYTLTVDGTEEKGVYTLASGAENFAGTISVVNTTGDELGTLTVGETATINGTEYLLTNEDNELSVTVTGGDTPSKPKWTYLVYMAADNDLCDSAIYDIVSMQQAKLDSPIDIYVLADRTPAGTEGSGDLETINGTYKWGADWEDTRVGRITYSPGLTVTVDWTSWGELDTGSIETLERFVNWAQEESPAENYGLILWDHGAENATLCFDFTTDRGGGACLSVSEVSGLLKEKGNIPLVIFNNCLLGSEITATQMAGSTDVIVVSEPGSYAQSTFNYNMFFHTITPDMTPQEMAAIMVRNLESPGSSAASTMLSAVDVTDSRLDDALEALAKAVAVANNDADKDVLIRAMLKAPQNGSTYDGTCVQQSDLGFMIRDILTDPDYKNTSEGFQKAIADVKTALEAIVLDFRSVPAKRGSGIAVCNPVYTAKVLKGGGFPAGAASARIQSYIFSTYVSNPLWGGLLNYLSATYLAGLVPTVMFRVSDVDGLVDGRTVSVSDIGCFSGKGEVFDGIRLDDEMFFGFVITAADKSTGSFTVSNGVGAEVTVSLLAADGTVVATGIGSVSFKDLAVGNYYLRLQSETDCRVTLSSDADWWTGVDRFEGNDSYETAAALDAGYHTGLITCKGAPDYYLLGNDDAVLYTVEVYGEEGWTVGEYDPDDGTLYEADYADGKYTLMMAFMGCLLVEGTADLANGVDAYSVNVIPYESDLPDDVTLNDLVGTKDGVSWEPSILMNEYIVEYSPDGFEHTMQSVTTGTAFDLLNLPAGTYQWRVTTDSGNNPEWFVGEEIVSDNTTAAPHVFRSDSDANEDIFFATPVGTWDSRYYAKHLGSVGDWTGTGEMVSAVGKGRIQDLFFGSADPGTLNLTDSDNGDALFLDDIYTDLPAEIEENTARLFRLREILAGAGDDIIDMTSQRFEYTGGNLSISGGDGDDVIWANRGARNSLFGDAGNDRIVGASGDDVIVGGIGNDRMHGGGGDDIFTFCENWGIDTVEQLETGTVTLWFLSGSMENWDEETLTYSDGENSVTVSGVSTDSITLKFEYGGSHIFGNLYNMGAFSEFCSKKIFNDTDKGILASG